MGAMSVLGSVTLQTKMPSEASQTICPNFSRVFVAFRNNCVNVRAEEWVLQVDEFVKGTEEHHVATQKPTIDKSPRAVTRGASGSQPLHSLPFSNSGLPKEFLDFFEWPEGWPRHDGEAEANTRVSDILRQGIWHDCQKVKRIRTFLRSLPACVTRNHESSVPNRLTLDSVGNSDDGQRFTHFPQHETSILQVSQNQTEPPSIPN